jgi:sialate O-acetylesterase
MTRTGLFAAVAALLLSLPAAARAEVRLPSIFTSHMVLQHGKPTRIWGWAGAGEKVTVEFARQTVEAQADDAGKWRAELAALEPSAESRTLKVTGPESAIELTDVLVGSVWVCSGQSNMEWSVTASLNAQEEISGANYPNIRLITVPKVSAPEPADNFEGAWAACTPETVPGFSAVAYFFGCELQRRHDMPVGLINAPWGGQPAEYFTPASAFEADPSLKETSDHPHAQNVMKTPSVLYNGMIAPLVPLAIDGVIWYQGESNVPMGRQYRKLFPAMIEGWRREFGQGDFPFLFVQIAPWNYGGIGDWPREGCPLVQEAQLMTLRLPNTGMVVTQDIGNVADIHPANKQEVGRRLALWACQYVYGDELVASGPIYKGHAIDGNKVVITFDHASGLKAAGEQVKWLKICGADKTFVDAEGTIVGDTLVVSSPAVAEPVAVRYAFEDIAEGNLFNAEGLPASPFRTDNE